MRVFKTGDTMKTDCTFFEDLILRYFFFFFFQAGMLLK